MTNKDVNNQPPLAFDDPIIIPVNGKYDRNRRKIACKRIISAHRGNINYLTSRVVELGQNPSDFTIVIANIDDENGGEVAELLLPGYDWYERVDEEDKDVIIFAVSLAERKTICEVLRYIDESTAEKLESATRLTVTVVDYGVAAVF